MNDLQSILKDLHAVFGLNISLFDLDENLIASYPMENSPFCKLIKRNPKSREICRHCDHEAFERVKKSGEIEIYKCPFHLSEVCVPVYSYGHLAGFLMMGQALSDSPFDKDITHKRSKPYVEDEADLKEALKKMPIKTSKEIVAFSTVLELCAKYLTSTNTIAFQNNHIAYAAKKYIMEHMDEDITIEKLCSELYCSKACLVHHFKNVFDTTIHAFLIECRINKARELLNNKELSIQQISSMCGFNDTSYFSKVFKKSCRITPTQYRAAA